MRWPTSFEPNSFPLIGSVFSLLQGADCRCVMLEKDRPPIQSQERFAFVINERGVHGNGGCRQGRNGGHGDGRGEHVRE